MLFNLRHAFSSLLFLSIVCMSTYSWSHEGHAHKETLAQNTSKKKRVSKKLKANHPFIQVEDDPKLPRVLLIGDSISMGYTWPVREYLKGKANVHRPAMNCGPTTRGVANMKKWLGDKKWDVIHFNFGLHDLKYADKNGKLVRTGGSQYVPKEEYAKNLDHVIHLLQETGATLIWCTTTPVPEGSGGRKHGDAAKYNEVAAGVLEYKLGEDRIINDLYTFANARLSKIQRSKNVHFTGHGSKVLGKEVASIIAKHLPEMDPKKIPMAKGVVYHDVNENGKYDQGDKPLPNIKVSNGHEIVKTDKEGRYQLPHDDDTIFFVIKPRNWRTEIDKEWMVPRFYYIHKPKGSIKTYFKAVEPTGPLPESIDFALYPQQEPNQFKAIFFGDPQPRNQKEVDYVAHDVVEELLNTDASFGVTLGDITFDNLDLFETQSKAIALIGIPWYNIIGNHDINHEAKNDDDSDESFERAFGPVYYSFDHGAVHFIVIDNIEWVVNKEGKKHYQGGMGKEQVEFIKRDLEMIPKDQLVVLMMHVPIQRTRDRFGLYRLIEKRPFCMSIAGHEHFHEHQFIGKKDGWRGAKPHHHVINVTVSGSWWSGQKDERGIPHTIMSQGAPNGYSIMSFDGHEYKLTFKAAGRPSDYQMNIYAPDSVSKKKDDNLKLMTNVFNGSEKSKIEFKIGKEGKWQLMKKVWEKDPAVVRIYKAEKAIQDKIKKADANPERTFYLSTRGHMSSHLWKAMIPTKSLPIGTHLIEVRTTDMHGQKHKAGRVIRVLE